MSVEKTLKTRISTRAFLDKPVAREELEAILEIARWSPSGGNVQPWRVDVVMGPARDRLIETVRSVDPTSDESEFPVYPPSLHEPYRARRYKLGEDMYELLGIPREDKPARLAQFAKNLEFFGAPVGLFFSLERVFNENQWAHLGMFMLSIALVAEERGLATCFQEAWMTRGETIAKFLDLPEEMRFYCGMSLGWPAPDAPVNKLRSDRAEVSEFATFHSA